MAMFQDMIRLFACYNDGIINLLGTVMTRCSITLFSHKHISLLYVEVHTAETEICLFFEVASRLSSSSIPSYDFYRNFIACAVTVVIFGHFNRFFTYFIVRQRFMV